MTDRDTLTALLDRWVAVSGPHTRTVWEGRLVGLIEDPCLILENSDGRMFMPQNLDVQLIAPPTAGTPPTPHGQPRLFAELRETGLLWLINRVVFHPRGLALALNTDYAGDVIGWSLLTSDGEPWTFDYDTDVDGHTRAEATLAAALGAPAHPTAPRGGDSDG